MKQVFLSILLFFLGMGLVGSPRGGFNAGGYDYDELYALLKKHPDRSSTPPRIFLEALPKEKLEEMTGESIKEIVYLKEEKAPHVFSAGYWADGRHILISIIFYRYLAGLTAKEEISQMKQNLRMDSFFSDITFVSLGDFGYLKVYSKEKLRARWEELEAFRKEYIPKPSQPPPLEATWEDFLRNFGDRVEVGFIKGEIMFVLDSYQGLLEPEEAIEIARRFEAIIK